MGTPRAWRLVCYVLPCLFCLAVYWFSLKSWFRADDFAWLGMRLDVQSWDDLWNVLFTPRAQGTVRVLSERVFFLAFSNLFGLEALPYHIWVFLTQFASMVLLAELTWRMTTSRLASFLAPVFWTVNSGLAVSISWLSSYNEILCGLVLLLALYFLERHMESGERRFYVAQWIVLLLGFAVLELNIVYPLLATLYCLCRARRYVWKTLPLFIPSALFAALHFWFIPKTADPQYFMSFDTRLPRTLWTYWQWALSFDQGGVFGDRFNSYWIVAIALLTVAIVTFVIYKAAQRQWLPLFWLGWFLIVISPVLPLPDHIMDYYLAVPSIGLSVLGAWMVGSAANSGAAAKTAAVIVTAVFLVVSLIEVRGTAYWYFDQERTLRTVLLTLQEVHRHSPDKIILLHGVDSNLFWSGFMDHPFRLIDIPYVYLTPGSDESIKKNPAWGDVSKMVLGAEQAVEFLTHDRALVFAVTHDRITEVTNLYRSVAIARFQALNKPFVDAGLPAYAKHLGPTWHKIEDGTRWMPKTATVQIAGPNAPGQKLYLRGFCAAEAVADGPLDLTIRADGKTMGTAKLTRPGVSFVLDFPVPANLTGKPSIELALEVSRTFTVPNDRRELSLIFGTFAIK